MMSGRGISHIAFTVVDLTRRSRLLREGLGAEELYGSTELIFRWPGKILSARQGLAGSHAGRTLLTLVPAYRIRGGGE
jgi:hypothetical protein